MSFLGPIGLDVWAYVAIGAAVLAVGAYIIKMRRRRFEVPFSQLWRRVLEQKDANALWKQLKRLMSLLLILLILGLVLFAALDPDARRGRSQGAQRRDPARRVGVDEGDGRRRRRQADPRIDVAKAAREAARSTRWAAATSRWS